MFESTRTIPRYGPAFSRILQGDEIRRRHGDWIDACNPSFGPGIAERFPLDANNRSGGGRDAHGRTARM